MKERRLSTLAGVSGIGAVLAYVAATGLGGLLRPGYSHVSHDISKLTEAGAPNRNLLVLIYSGYNLLLGVFATGLFLSSKRSRLFATGRVLLLVNCLSGVLQVTVFRRDPGGVPLTRRGIGHIVGAGISSLCTVAQSLVFGVAFRHDAFWRPLAGFSFASGIAIVVTGMSAAIGTVAGSKVMGLLERITIGLFLLWVFVLSGYTLLRGYKE